MNPRPSRDRLEQFLADQVNEAEAAALEAHVEGCATCQQTLEQLTDQEPSEPRRADRARNDDPDDEFVQRLEKALPTGMAVPRYTATNMSPTRTARGRR